MNRGFQVDPYGDFLGKIPGDILRLIPQEDRRSFAEQCVANAKGKAVIGWSLADNGMPYPVIQGAEFSTHATF